jgi:hypothetical protein
MAWQKKAKSLLGSGAVRNLAIVGVVAGLGWFAYRRLFSTMAPAVPADAGWPGGTPGTATTPTAGAAAGSPMLPLASQPPVKKGEQVGTKTLVTVTKKEPGYRYMKITATSSAGVRTFRSSINGFFTGRLLNLKGKLYAEVRPA